MRLIVDPPAPAAHNMALDEALLEAASWGAVPPTLRFYSFAPAALTLGYSQSLADVNLAACREAGVEVRHRPTGGRAVLHDRDLTYAWVQAILPGESVKASYCRLSNAIAAAIRSLGVAAAVAPAAPPLGGSARPADCFALSTAADLVVEGRKIVGSAQVRRRGFLLQHGSIRLTPPVVSVSTLLVNSLSTTDPASILGLLGGVTPPDEAGLAGMSCRLSRAIAAELEVAWRPASWTEYELELASAIAARNASAPRPPASREAAPQAAG